MKNRPEVIRFELHDETDNAVELSGSFVDIHGHVGKTSVANFNIPWLISVLQDIQAVVGKDEEGSEWPQERPTTIEGWLKTLPEPHRSRALKNMEDGSRLADSLPYALIEAFMWEDAEEGHIYWNKVHDGDYSAIPR